MEPPARFTRCMLKKQLCQSLDISPRCLRRWLNERYIDQLTPLGYTPRQKLLTPAQLNYLAAVLDIEAEKGH